MCPTGVTTHTKKKVEPKKEEEEEEEKEIEKGSVGDHAAKFANKPFKAAQVRDTPLGAVRPANACLVESIRHRFEWVGAGSTVCS
jgi:hypothetical protein